MNYTFNMKLTCLTLLFVFFQFTLWFGENSVWKIYALNQNIVLQREKNQKLRMHTLRLEHEVKGLKKYSDDPPPLAEDYIRWHLGLVKQGECFFRW